MIEQKLINADFYEWCMNNLEDDSVDSIITDPPYPKAFLPLWSKLGEVALKKLKPSGLLIAYSGQYHLPKVMELLGQHLNYYWTGCLLHTGHNGVVFPTKFIPTWKPILFYQKPPYKALHKATTDLVRGGGRDKVGHEWKQAVGDFIQLIEYFTEPNDLILEPFAGAGTTLVACKQLNRNCIGIEIDKKYIEVSERGLDVNYLF